MEVLQRKSSIYCTEKVLGSFAALTLIFALLFSTVMAHSQLSVTGSIAGAVADASGAVIPGAQIIITQTETGTITQTVSNSAGEFDKVGLSPGHYAVTVSMSGFATYRQTGIYLDPMATFTVNATLKPGSVSENVTVVGSQEQVQTTTPEVSSTVSGEETEALPLNGRNYQGLGSLMPGVINTSPLTQQGSGGYLTNNTLSVNGSGTGGSLYTVDGIWNIDYGEHNQNTVIPNPDAISELKVLQNNYSAQYTLMGNGVILVQTKSGTDLFHGGAWEFLRNTDLDTRNYFQPATQGPPAEEGNIFGWNLGGPLEIPKIYNPGRKKTFFYVNQQWVRQKQASVLNGAVATSDMRKGVFPQVGSGSLYLTSANGGWLRDPRKTGTCNATNQTACFPNNQITAPLDANALAMLNAVVPLPNNQQSQSTTFNNYINTKPTLTDQMDVLAKLDINLTSKLRLTGEYMTQSNTSTSPSASRMGSNLGNNWDLFDSTDQVAQLQLLQMYTPNMTNQTSVSMSNMVEAHDIGGISHISQVTGFHQVLPYTNGFLQDYLPFVSISGGWTSFGASSCCIIPRFTSMFNAITDNWSWLHGKHFVQAGMTMLFAQTRQWNTGSPLQDGSFTFNGNNTNTTGNPLADFLLGDAYSFTQGNTAYRRVMRFPIASPFVQDQWKAMQRFTLTAGLRWFFLPWSNIQTGTAASFVPSLFNPANAPIVATNGQITNTPTYNPANGMVLNGVNGIPQNFTNKHQYYLAPVLGFAWDLFGNGRSSLRGGYGLTYFKVTEDGCAQGCVNPPLLASVNITNINFSDPVGASPVPTAPGTTGVDLNNYRAAQIQNFSLTLEQQFGANWFISIGGAGSVTTHEPIGTAGPIFPIGQPAPTGVYDFNPAINSGTSNAYYSPYPGYASVGLYQSVFKGSWYALETSIEHPIGRNLYLKSAYTWSHNLDNMGGWVNPYKISKAYGNSTVDGNTPHVFTTSLIYSEPFFQHGARWQQLVLGGWKYSDMTTIQSGSSLSMGMSASKAGLATRPNQNAYLSYPKAWKTGGNWFDTSIFSQPAPGYYGNIGNGTILGPGLVNFNMATYKTFAVKERVNIQFRAEFFNVFNHTNPNAPNASYANGNFGKITGAAQSRVGEMAMKINF